MPIQDRLSIALLSVLCAAPVPLALGQDPDTCRTAVQGKIAWDRKGHTTWDERSLDRLCAGVASAEPARCFDRVMHGGVDWSHGTRWNTSAAIALCRGTTDAKATVECFEWQLRDNVEFGDAIDTCARKGLPRPDRSLATREAPPVAVATPPPAPARSEPPPPAPARPVDTAPPHTTAQAADTESAASPEGALAGDCGAEREVLCANLVADCAPSCAAGPDSSACRSCITGTYTMGIDCGSCLYGGTGSAVPSPPAPYFACRDFVCAAPEGGSNPRVRGAAGRIGEECGPCRTEDSRRARSIKHCCLLVRERRQEGR